MPESVTAFGPGRVNLIGEHTDYNAGLAMPFAIERGVTVTATPAKRWTVDALDFGERDEFDAPERVNGWRAFHRGMVAELRHRAPAHLEISGDVPRGSGLSSSAALEAALALALLRASRATCKALAKLCSKVENDWVGAETGLLDQFASLMSQPGPCAADRLPLARRRAAPARPRRLAAGHGRFRRDAQHRRLGLQRAPRRVPRGVRGTRHRVPARRRRPERASTARCCAAPATWSARTRASTPPRRRSRPTTSRAVAELLDASHASLRDDYEASVPEVEATVERLKAAGAAGARMVGGGFGGSVLALLPPGVAAARRCPRGRPARSRAAPLRRLRPRAAPPPAGG